MADDTIRIQSDIWSLGGAKGRTFTDQNGNKVTVPLMGTGSLAFAYTGQVELADGKKFEVPATEIRDKLMPLLGRSYMQATVDSDFSDFSVFGIPIFQNKVPAGTIPALKKSAIQK